MNRFIAIVALLSFAAFGDGPSPVTKTRLGSLHPREGLVVTDIDVLAIGGGIDTNAVNDLITSATKGLADKADAAYSAAESLADGVNSLAGTIGTHTRNTNNPHKVTAAQVGAVPLVDDSNGEKTAVTIGGRSSIGTVGKYSLANGQFVNASGYNSHAEGEGTTASGQFSHSEGQGTTASGYYSHAEGFGTTASGHFSHADGYESQTSEGHQYSFAWNGDTSVINRYSSHGPGTFNINPVGGADGFYIGEQTLSDVIFVSLTNNISAGNPTFSNAVLSVGLNIDTNSVDVLNEIASTFGGFPIEGTATTVGGLLAALAAAVTWLKRNKVQTIKLNDGSVENTAENGVAKLDDFFTESTGFTPPTDVAGALKNSTLEKSIVLAVTKNFGDADNTSYGSAT